MLIFLLIFIIIYNIKNFENIIDVTYLDTNCCLNTKLLYFSIFYYINVNKTIIKNITLIVIPLLLLIGAGITLVNIGIITTKIPNIESENLNVTLVIDYGNNYFEKFNFESSNTTVYSVLIEASVKYNFSVKSKYFDQYQSHYIYSIKSIEEGENNKFWQYYINEKYGSVGSDLLPVKDNDYIEWKFQEPKI